MTETEALRKIIGIVERYGLDLDRPYLTSVEADSRLHSIGLVAKEALAGPDVDALVADGIILPSEVQYLEDGRSRWPIPAMTGDAR